MTCRRRCATAALAVVAVIGLAACTSSGTPEAAPAGRAAPQGDRPNIVFVLTDDLAMNLVPYMPHVLALERQGTTFSDYTVTDSLCCPSRSSIFTGRFPHDTGVFTNGGRDGGFQVFHDRGEEHDTFATSLRGVGYRTAMMGKYLNGYQPGGRARYVPPGWDEWDVAGNGYAEFNYNLNVNHRVVHHGRAPRDYLTDVLSGRAQRFIVESVAARRPFLLEVATFAPHIPYTPAPRDAKAFPGLRAPRTAAYDRLPTDAPRWLARWAPLSTREQHAIDVAFRKRVQDVQSVDRMIGAIERSLAAAGVAGDTDIVFSSDNGYHMGEYRLSPGKMTAFDTDVHVPLVVAGPGVRAGATVSQPVQNVDLRPTFDALAGAPTPSTVDGHSLVPLLRGQPQPDWRTAALVEHHGPDTDARDPDHPGTGSGNPPSYEALRTTRYTYVEYADGTREYYDRTADPNELHNVVGRLSPATLTMLHDALRAMATCHGRTACWTAAHDAR